MPNAISLDNIIGRLCCFSTVNQTLTTGVNAPIIFQNIVEDNTLAFNPGGSIITINDDINRIKITVKASMAAQAVVAGVRTLITNQNGLPLNSNNPNVPDFNVSGIPVNTFSVPFNYTTYWIPCVKGDTFQIIARQTSGGNLDLVFPSILIAEFGRI